MTRSGGDEPDPDDRAPDGVSVRRADPSEFVAVMRLLEGALLDVSADRVRAAIDGGEALVAAADGRLAGSLVRDGDRVVAVAVRPGRRGRGIGSALIEAADGDDAGRLLAAFDPSVRPFYESLGFDVRPAAEEGRLLGVRERGSEEGG